MTPTESYLRSLDLGLLRALKAGHEHLGSLNSMELARQIQREIVRRARAQSRAARKQRSRCNHGPDATACECPLELRTASYPHLYRARVAP